MQKETENSDELTLSELNRQLQLLGGFLYGILMQYVKSMRKYWLWMISLLIVIVSAAGSYSYYSRGVFRGTASYTYNYLQKKTYGEMIDELGRLVEAHAYLQLEYLLHLNPQSVKSLSAINARNIYGSPLSDDMNENDKYKVFYITVEAKNSYIFGQMAVAIENYLNNNIAVREYKKRNETKFAQNIRYRQSELRTIDSIQRAYISAMDKPTVAVLPMEASQFNPVQLSEKGEKITEEIADMESFLGDPRAVKLQTQFLVSNQDMKRSLVKIFFVAFLFFILLSVVIVFILSTYSREKHAS